MIIHHHNKFFFTIIALTVVCCYTTLVVLWDRYGLVCLIHWHVWRHETPHQKILRTFVMPARTHCAYTRLLSWVSRVGWVTHVKYAAHASENASHVATLALDVPFPGLMFFFLLFVFDLISGKSCLTRSRHKRSLWPFRSAVSRRPCRAPFWSFFLGFTESRFFVIFCLSSNFFVISIIINESLGHSIIKICCQHVMKSSKLVNTRKMVKNGRF
jgi:hypothetical protein